MDAWGQKIGMIYNMKSTKSLKICGGGDVQKKGEFVVKWAMDDHVVAVASYCRPLY